MADFSYEYCLKHFGQTEEEANNFSDFKISELIKDLKEGNYIDIIDEGYGYNGIAKFNGKIYFLYGDSFDSGVEEKDLDNFINDNFNKKYYTKLLNE